MENLFLVKRQSLIEQGGGQAFGFYCHAPSGVMVEVSTPAN
jgi:hypothetical protein